MILSMTGYGKATATFGGKKIHAEIRSLNSKNLDLSLRMPARYHEREMELRRQLTPLLVRGKADVTVWTEEEAAAVPAAINAEAVRAYAEQLREVSRAAGIAEPADPWTVLTRLPDVVRTEVRDEATDEEWQAVAAAVEAAAEAFQAFRQQEGAALEKKFAEKLDNIAALMAQVEPFETLRTDKIRQRLEERLAELVGIDYDRARLEQEMIFYIEKLDISEEKQRLANHLAYFRATMAEGGAQGKKLGFIAQEMGREINTTGSKSNLAEMQNLVVRMKDELEQIKEQVLNVL
ncbi:MAG: YicC family protein [Bacteroidaceae bacterium]|nr:YicC family protein [Bacteroidaceae bacterium]